MNYYVKAEKKAKLQNLYFIYQNNFNIMYDYLITDWLDVLKLPKPMTLS